MHHTTQPTTSLARRLALIALCAAITLAVALPIPTVQARQDAAAKKEDAKKDEATEGTDVPPPIKPDDDDWLAIEPFDRLRMSVDNVPDRVNLVRKNDKNVDAKLSPDEWPDTVPYSFESFDWNADGFVDDKELIGIILDVELLEERPLPKPIPGAPVDARLRVRLATGAHLEFDVMRNRISEVKYWEDLVLDQGRRAMGRNQMDKAFELLDHVAARQPNWPGMDQAIVDFWFAEAEERLRKLDDGRALDFLYQMSEYAKSRGIPEHPEARRSASVAIKRLVERAFEKKEYMLARPRLYALLKDYEDLPVGHQMRDLFIRESDRKRREAKQHEANGNLREACLAIIEAADIWPNLDKLDEDFQRIFHSYPILHVGVRELPERFSPWPPPGTPDSRVAQLIHVPLMEVSGVGENTKYNSRLVQVPELAELGRRIVLRVKPDLLWSDGEKAVTGYDVARSITTRADRRVPNYDAALASVLKEVRVTSVQVVEVDLNRTPLRPQSNFLFNLAAGHRLLSGPSDQTLTVGAGPFRVVGRKTGTEAYLQANKHFFAGPPHIAEIIERRFPSGKDAVRALLIGDIALLENVPHKELRRIEARSSDLTIVRSAVPALHAISFDFRAKTELQNWTLRRAMMYAIDRRQILEGALLDGPSRDGNEVVNGPFPKGSYAYEPSLEPWPHDPVLAKALVEAAKKELRVQNLRFNLYHPDTEDATTACNFIKDYWNRILNIQIDLRPMPTQQLEEEVALGRRFELVYRVHYVRDPVLDAPRVLCLGPPIAPDGAVMPNAASPWLRQNLRDLEFATNWPIAQQKLELLQQQARDDVALIPLWQLNDYAAFHQRLSGVAENPIGIYQDAEKWQIEPWYRQDSKQESVAER